MRCRSDGQSGWKFGESGTCFVGDDARSNAIDQMQAMFASGFIEKQAIDVKNVFSTEQWEMHLSYFDHIEDMVRLGWEEHEWAHTEDVHDLLFHSSFFEALGKSGEPNTGLMTKITETFGSLENLFDLVLSRSIWSDQDWVIIAFDYNFGRLVVSSSRNYLPDDMKILFALDMKEHARILDFKFDKLAYVRQVLNNINWNVVNSRFDSILVKSREKVHICKTSEEGDERLVFGWANVSLNAEGDYPLDYDGHIMEPEVLEKAAYEFVLDFRDMGERHAGESKGTLVESMMFTKEKMDLMGIPEGTLPEGWWIGFHVEDEVAFQKIKDGEYSMFSIQGTGTVEPIEDEGGATDE